MRVLVYGLSSQLGGIEAFFINYYSAMKNNELNIICDVIGVPNCVLKQEITDYGGNVYEIEGNYKNYISDFMAANAKKYSILWANLVDLSDKVVLKQAHQYGIKNIIVHGHSSSIMVSGIYGKYRKLRHLYNRATIEKYANNFWSCSDLSAKWMFPGRVIKNNKDEFIPNAIRAEKYRFDNNKRLSLREKEGFKDELILGYIGRMSFEKNPLYAVKVFVELRKRKQNTRLLMIGDGILRSEVENYVNENKIENVVFLGVCKDVPDKMQMLDAVIIPSFFEGMPMVALEAQAAGLHVFASNALSHQTKLLSEFDFLSLEDGPEAWAGEILKYNLKRRDTYNDIVNAGFELSTASITLYERFKYLAQ